MPMLTTLLMYKSEVNLSENMKKFRKVIKLNSLTTEEMFMRNATKSNQMQLKAIEIIQDAMKKIMDTEHENAVREVSLDAFIQACNASLLKYDPSFANTMGLKIGDEKKNSPTI